jgi:hypothetical protein
MEEAQFGQCVQRAGEAVVWHMLCVSHEIAMREQ